MTDANYDRINTCFRKILGRMVDDEGYNVYKNFDTKTLEAILKESDEYLHYKRKQPEKMKAIVPENIKRKTQFDIVVARYKEDPSFLDIFTDLPCRVFLYNKGDTITHKFKSDIIIIDLPNVSFEEYAYLTHITSNYYNMRPTVFMQCALDHCPDILKFLEYFDSFGPFESMSQGLGYKDFADNSFQKKETAFGSWYTPNSLDFAMVKYVFKGLNDWEYPDDIDPITFIEQRYGVKVSFPYFAPGAQVYVHNSCIQKYSIGTYTKLKTDIETLNTFGRHVTSRFQEFLERYFWSSVWSA